MWFGKLLSVIKREYFGDCSRKVVLLFEYQQKMRVSGEMTVIMVPALQAVYIQMDKEKICVNVQRKKRWKFSGFTILSTKIIKSRLCDQSDYLSLHWEHTCCI